MPHEHPAADLGGLQPSTAGERVRAAITSLQRWGSRSDVRRSLVGPAPRDLSMTELWLLSAVTEHGPVRVSDLAGWQGVDKSTITPQVRRLEARGLVSRRPDPDDGRAWLLSGTAEGGDVLRQSYTAGAAVIDDILRDWDAGDREVLATLFARFAEQLTHKPLRRPQVPPPLAAP